MKLVKSHIDSDGSGGVTLCPEEPEDMVGRELLPIHGIGCSSFG